MQIKDLEINDFKLDPYDLPKNKYTLKEGGKGFLNIGDAKFKISHAELVHNQLDNVNEDLGLKIHISEDDRDIAVTLWASTKEIYSLDSGLERQGGGNSVKGKSIINELIEFTKLEENGDPDLKKLSIQIQVTPKTCKCTDSQSSTGFNSPKRDKNWYKLLDKVVEKEYAGILNPDTYNGSKMNYASENKTISNISKQDIINSIDARSMSGFPILEDNSIVIPWLGATLKATQSGGKYIANTIFEDKTKITFDALKGLTNDQLPIDISKSDVLKFLGLTGKNDFDPSQHRLLITGFETNGSPDQWSVATMELTIVHYLNIGTKKGSKKGRTYHLIARIC